MTQHFQVFYSKAWDNGSNWYWVENCIFGLGKLPFLSFPWSKVFYKSIWLHCCTRKIWVLISVFAHKYSFWDYLVIFWALQIGMYLYVFAGSFWYSFLISGKCTAMYWGSNWMNGGQWMIQIHVQVLRAKSNFPWNW